jgi:hypothetical protein
MMFGFKPFEEWTAFAPVEKGVEELLQKENKE